MYLFKKMLVNLLAAQKYCLKSFVFLLKEVFDISKSQCKTGNFLVVVSIPGVAGVIEAPVLILHLHPGLPQVDEA